MSIRITGTDLSHFSGPNIFKYEIIQDDVMVSDLVIRNGYAAEIHTTKEVLTIKSMTQSSVEKVVILRLDGEHVGRIEDLSSPAPRTIIYGEDGDVVWRPYS